MSVPEYTDGKVVIPAELDLAGLKDKSVLITGGGSGLGLAYANAFAKAGAFVTIVDFNKDAGQAAEKALAPKAVFVPCDVRKWEDQVAAFEAAVIKSPRKSLDIVIANAGTIGRDDLYTFDDPGNGPPAKPELRTVDVNLYGTLYTAKLALHYFRRQPLSPEHDRCLIIKGSIAAYADQPGSPQYNVSKWGARGLFRNLRRTVHRENIRVNFVAPWYVRTPILSEKIIEYLEGKGVHFATVDDCARAMLNIASDTTIHGRAFGIVPRVEAPQGYMDLEHDDYQEGDFMKGWQETVLATAQSIVDLA
ncbi:hypothetical protein SEUCBS140593_010310 [Sporothrix eucalyptigena]|uniref:Short chain dehydrogenase reductase n=1 Tax=Sporothrix eucalyptigena TaxID=1812306 RepID=A0ABP0D3M8_9PEZI